MTDTFSTPTRYAVDTFYHSLGMDTPDCPRGRFALISQGQTAVAACASRPVRMRLRGKYIRVGLIDGLVAHPDLAVPEQAWQAARQAMELARRHGNVLMLFPPHYAQAPLGHAAAFETETCTLACPAQGGDGLAFYPLTCSLVPAWQRYYSLALSPFGAMLPRSQDAMRAQLTAHLSRPGGRALAAMRANRVCGWWLGTLEGRHADTQELYLEDEGLYLQLPQALGALGADTCTWLLPGKAQPNLMLKTQPAPPQLARALNVEALFYGLGCDCAGRAYLEVDDPLFPENRGLWCIEGGPQGARATRAKANHFLACARVTAGGLASFLLGNPMALRGDGDQITRLTRMFPPCRALWWTA
nr:hypothetical protein [bacterium]